MLPFHLAKRLGRRDSRSHHEVGDGGTPAIDAPGSSSSFPTPLRRSRDREQAKGPVPLPRSSTHGSRSADSPSTDPVGLHVVYTPGEAPKADIVFVHGLGGTSRMTWSKNRSIELFWPKEFLPEERDLCHARVLTFGYNAAVTSTTSPSSRILDFAKDLLFELKYARDIQEGDLRIGEIPLIFIAHSMGGLIVKEAYLLGQQDPAYTDLVKSVAAIVFLSTPHRGSNLAETLNRILRVSFVSTPKSYVAELVKNSFTVQKLNEQFRHVAPKLNIMSFYETQPTAVGLNHIMIVGKDSSVLGYPGEVSKALDADHHTVCKYDSPHDPSYIAVRNYLRTTIGKLFSSSSSKASTASLQSITTSEVRELEEVLSITEPADADYIFFRDRWVPGTCEWILQHETFVNWLRGPDDSGRLLWLSGVPGSGKSVMSSFIVNYLVNSGKSCQYVFIRFGDLNRRSLGTTLRSLAFQIAHACPPFRQAVRKMTANLKLQGADPPTIWHRIFRTILFRQDIAFPLYWVIDGFEECDQVRNGIKLLLEVLDKPLPIRILLTSRRTVDLEGEIKKVRTSFRFSAIELDSNIDDCRRLIAEELDWLHIPEFSDRITQKLLEAARGSLLWIKLTVDRINRCHTEAAVEDALQELHPGMKELYDHMAASLGTQAPADSRVTKRILAWVACGRRSLTLVELAEALETDTRDILDLPRSIKSLCSGFVVVDNDGSVAVVHETAREYLLRSEDTTVIVDGKVAHQDIFLRCVRCISGSGLRRKIKQGQAPVLLGYAVQYIFIHLWSCSPESDRVVDAVVTFLRGPAILTWIHAVASVHPMAVFLQASASLSAFARRLGNVKLVEVVGGYREAEHRLIDGWATELGKVVGKFGRQLRHQPDSIYTTIPPFCPINSMLHKQFVRKGSRKIVVTGISTDWDDCLARMSFIPGYEATGIAAEGCWIAVVGTCEKMGKIMLYHAGTHEEFRQLNQGERIRKIHINSLGTLLVSCGYSTTKVWDIESGTCVAVAKNPPARPYPQTVLFSKDDECVLIGTNDRRIWSVSLSEPETTLEEVTRIVPQQGGSPHCAALSPDGELLSFGYRHRSLSVWDLETSELAASCDELSNVAQLVWHPHSGELFGLMHNLSGIVFKWYPSDDDPITQYIEASVIAINNNGSILALGDQHGNIKLLDTADLVLIFQVASQDPVLGLAFSADCRHLYDVRSSYANVWEPNVLLNLSDLAPQLSDNESDSGKTLVEPISLSSDEVYARVDPISAVAANQIGQLYCVGTLAGVARLCHITRGELCILNQSANFFSIQQIAWSGDGKQVCYADVSRTVFVDAIQMAPDSVNPEVTRLLQLHITYLEDNISRVIFHRDGHRILVCSHTAAVLVSLDEKSILATTSTEKGAVWIQHPANPDQLLLVSHNGIFLYLWSSLDKTTSIPVDTYGNRYFDHSSKRKDHIHSSLIRSDEELGGSVALHGVLTTPSNRHMLVLASDSTSRGLVRLLRIECPGYLDTQSQGAIQLVDVALPAEVITRLDRPLGFISSQLGSDDLDTLLFLDCNAWLCSWKIVDPGPGHALPRSGHSQLVPTAVSPQRLNLNGKLTSFLEDSATIRTHFCLPGDWVSPGCAALFRLSRDGTLLCPRNGEMIVIQWAESLK